MSLIQEALKRQQQEAGEGELKNGPPPLQRPAAAPSPKPEPALKPEPPPLKNDTPTVAPAETKAPPPRDKSKKRETAGAKTGKTIVLILLLAAVGGLVWYQMKPPARKSTHAGPTAETTTQQAADPVPVLALTPITEILDSETSVAKPQASDPITEPLTPEELLVEIEWPSLLLNGIVGSGAQGSCLINNQIVRVGEHVQGVKVAAIRKDGVELEYQGEKRYLRVGASTL